MRPGLAVVLLIAAILSLSTAAVAADRPRVEDGTLSVRDGRATIQLRMRGGIIGRFARGNLKVTDLGTSGSMVVRGADKERDVNDRTTIYSGNDIRFRIVDADRFVVRLNGSKINFSAVGRGDGWLDGWGDRADGIFFDGSFSLNGEPYRSIPDVREPFELEAPRSA